MSVRPTPDRLRETLFNILALRLPGKVFLDAYAGSGAVGIEAFSRGAAQVILIEKHPDALAVIRENIRSLGIQQGLLVAKGAAARLLPNYRCDIAFVDPPYEQRKEYDLAIAALDANGCPLVIAQHESKMVMPPEMGQLRKVRAVTQGENMLTFFERTTEC